VATAVSIPPVALWFDWRFEGLDNIPKTGPAIVACNHLSYLDPLANARFVMKAGRRPRFLAKGELFEIPLVGTAFRGAKQIRVDRGSRDLSPLRQAQRALTEDEVVVIYPEGTVTTREDHLPMQAKTGTVRLALASGVPIVPLAQWGSQAVWQKSGRGSLRYGRPIWLKAGAPIDLSARQGEAGDRHALRAMTADLVEALTTLVEDLRDRYPARWASPG
jgi:1-acyl-sn-glycerol-3-phosphate acyltransferase